MTALGNGCGWDANSEEPLGYQVKVDSQILHTPFHFSTYFLSFFLSFPTYLRESV